MGVNILTRLRRDLASLAPLIALIFCGAAPASAQQFVLPAQMAGQTVLYVGAHPDDEWGVTPILADACLNRGARCHFVTLANGPGYGCLLTIGLRDPHECSRRRSEEMSRAAAYFGGSADLFGLGDLFYAFNEAGMNRTIAEWSESSGGREALVGRLRAIIMRERPTLILTFDPRHGSSCHSGHRAAATLLVEAVRGLPEHDRPAVWLEQTTDMVEAAPGMGGLIDALGYVPWNSTIGQTVFYDANRRLPDGMTGFDHVIAERRIHATQMPDEASGKVVPNPPRDWRRVPLHRLDDSVAGDFCTGLNLDRPTLDFPENRKRFGID